MRLVRSSVCKPSWTHGSSLPLCVHGRSVGLEMHRKSLCFSRQSKSSRIKKTTPKFPVAICKLGPDKHGVEITPEKLQILRGYKLQFQLCFFHHLIQLLKGVGKRSWNLQYVAVVGHVKYASVRKNVKQGSASSCILLALAPCQG